MERSAPPSTIQRLRLAFFLTTATLLVEVCGGLLANSLALLADAGHVLTDIFALGLAWFAAHQALRPADERRTYGYHRTGILAALANAMVLIVVALAIAFEAYQRLQAPQTVNGPIMLVAACFGLVINIIIGLKLSAEGSVNLNVRSAFIHVVGDAAAGAGVIVAAIIIAVTHVTQADPIISVAIALLVCIGAWRIITDTVRILMEAAPAGLNLSEVVDHIRNVSGIKDVHDLHVWSISNEMTALSCHVLIEDQRTSEIAATLEEVKHLLRDHYHVGHATIEVECDGCEADSPYCWQPAELTPTQTAPH